MPTIGVNGSLGTSSSSMSDRDWEQQIKTNFDAGVGVSLSVPIFDGRQTKTAVNKATLQRKQAELDLQNNEYNFSLLPSVSHNFQAIPVTIP